MSKTPLKALRDQFIARVLRHDPVSPEDIDLLLHRRVEEDVRLDYKSGAILQQDAVDSEPGKPNTFEGKLRKHVCALANAEGGVLLIGVGEPPLWERNGRREADPRLGRRIDGVVGLSASKAEERAARALQKLRPSLSTGVAVSTVEHPQGLVLLVGVGRSDSLVSVVEHEQIQHYLRIGDSTVHAPGYLVEDIVLGRRRRPSMDVDVLRVERNGDRLTIALTITNTGFVWLEHTQVGVVCYSARRGGILGGELPDSLGHQISLTATARRDVFPSIYSLEVAAPTHATDAELVAPFQQVGASTGPYFLVVPSYFDEWVAAVYVAQLNQPPVWYQLAIWRYGDEVQYGIIPCGEERPIVEIDAPRRWDWKASPDQRGKVTLIPRRGGAECV